MAAGTMTGVVTPEAVLLDFDTAGAGSRILAEALDLLIQMVALVVLGFALAAAAGALQQVAWLVVVLFLMLFLGVLVGYPAAMETLWQGRTLGKAALGLRVVTVEGGPERFRHAMIRAVIGLVEIIMFYGLPALLAIIFSKRNQRLGDMVAGTIVLRERDVLKAGKVAQAFFPPPGYEAYAASIDTTGLTERQYQVVRNFLLRATQLLPQARATLGVNLANPVALTIQHDPPPTVPPEVFLCCVAAAYQLRHGGPAAFGPPAAPIWSAPPPPAGAGWSAPPPTGAPSAGGAPPPPPAGWSPPPPPPAGWSPPPPPPAGWSPPPPPAPVRDVHGPPAGWSPPPPVAPQPPGPPPAGPSPEGGS